METNDDGLETDTISALLSHSDSARRSKLQEILPRFSTPLKTNFENSDLWLRFGLTLSLTRDSPHSALQAFNECLRIDQSDPLPAILAAKLVLEDLNDPDQGLELASLAIERCENSNTPSKSILSKCYLLASIMHAQIYEREPESIRKLKTTNLEASLKFLDLASETNPHDYLIYFHKALHDAKKRSFTDAIENARQAIKLNPRHVPSIQLFILSLSALRHYDEAFNLCQSALHDFEDNLLLLYIKCNLEQTIESKGFNEALETARHILKCIRFSASEDLNTANHNEALPKQNHLLQPPQPLSTPQHQQQGDTRQQTTNLFSESKLQNCPAWQNPISNELSAWLLVAEIFIKLGLIQDAELCVDEGSAHVDGTLSHQVMLTRGLIAKARNNLMEAKSFYQSCLAISPRHPRALQQIAHVHYLLGNYSTAEKFLEDSTDVDSDCHETWYYKSLVFIETNQHEKANECVEKSRVLEESSPVIPISAISRLTLE